MICPVVPADLCAQVFDDHRVLPLSSWSLYKFVVDERIEADPVILAEYITALLKNDKSASELQKLCSESLIVFLGNDTTSFVEKLFQALKDGSLAPSTRDLDIRNQVKHPTTSNNSTNVKDNSLSSPKGPKDSSPSAHLTDSEDKEASDEDDDRNHKHRRREPQPFSSDKDAQESTFKRPNKKRKPFENGCMFLATGYQAHDVANNHSTSESGKFEKRRPGWSAGSRTGQDFNQKMKGAQPFNGFRFDSSRFSTGRGRGQASSWNQHDSRFGPLDALDYASQMASLGSTPTLFNPTAQTPSWGPFGLIHGVPNCGLDALNPIGLHGPLQSQINPTLSIGIPRQRCNDFEERGFCLQGDMCPMEHGVNRIVVDDVQSLSQFNLPVSLPTARVPSVQGGAGPTPPASSVSSSFANTKSLQSKNIKVGDVEGGADLPSRIMSGSTAGSDADVYDPDQPLWIDKVPEVRHRSPKVDYSENIWKTVASDNYNNSEHHSEGLMASSLVIPDRKRDLQNRLEKGSNAGSANDTEEEIKPYQMLRPTDLVDSAPLSSQDEATHSTFTSSQGPRTEPTHGKLGRGSYGKASQTLYVGGIPPESNKRVLFSHFQKFGVVIDIHIPQNSSKAFVQFAKREEAEAALKAPDAVMGNRFIKLRWANRDNIPQEVVQSMKADSNCIQPLPAASVSTKPMVAAIPVVSTKTDMAQKFIAENERKVVRPSQKQLETLELMKKKQELLDQKRNALLQQLDNFKKQAASVKDDTGSESATIKEKVDAGASAVKSTSCPESMKEVRREGSLDTQTLPDDRSCSGEVVGSPSSSKVSSAMRQHSLKSLKTPNHFSRSSFAVNRFKLDNRPTSFGILPPLPSNISNVMVLKAHFSSFGDFASVELEDSKSADVNLSDWKSSHKYAARVAYTTRHSAERAFLNGRCLQGHTLNFAWLMPSSNSRTSPNSCNNSPFNSPSILKPAIEIEAWTSVATSTGAGKSNYSMVPTIAVYKCEKAEGEIVESANGSFKSLDEELDEASLSSYKQVSEPDVD